ncbi:MAG: quinate 5-dehydrogenase [Bacillota bacterium]|nr:quinate 5-dehydrogenase [Bacillota bacterium]
MKHVVSVSLGSSTRDHRVEVELLGERFLVERRGTDGDMARAVALIRELDGRVDCFGMGGIDLYLAAGRRRYILRDAVKLARAARRTPIVDGSGLKETLERMVVQQLAGDPRLGLRGSRVLLVSAMDRFGMAEALVEAGAKVTFGDFLFALGLPIPLRSLRTLSFLAAVLVPVIAQLPFSLLYPVGREQERISTSRRYSRWYLENDWIAGDWLYIRRHLPERLTGQVILTNTVTAADVELLRERGAGLLVTTTPRFGSRSFGTNVMEALLVAASGRRPEELTAADYRRMLEQLGFRPHVEALAGSRPPVSTGRSPAAGAAPPADAGKA